MAINLSGWAIEEIAPGARQARILNEVLTEGVKDLAGGSFEVTSDNAMRVKVGSGTAGDVAYVEGVGGTYAARNPDAYIGQGVSDVPITPGDVSWNRHDIVVLRVYDNAEDASGTNDLTVEVVEGAPSSSPSDPALPSGTLPLARVIVPAGETTSIDAGDIVDLRAQSVMQPELLGDAAARLDRINDTLIGEFVNPNSALIIWADIPQDFAHLRIVGQFASDQLNTFINTWMRFQADGSSVYNYHQHKMTNAAGATTFETQGGFKFSNAEVVSYEAMIPNYSDTSTNMQPAQGRWMATHGALQTGMETVYWGGRYDTGGAIDNIRFFTGTGVFDTRTHISLYGLPITGYYA